MVQISVGGIPADMCPDRAAILAAKFAKANEKQMAAQTASGEEKISFPA
jgi:hypothetical protein